MFSDVSARCQQRRDIKNIRIVDNDFLACIFSDNKTMTHQRVCISSYNSDWDTMIHKPKTHNKTGRHIDIFFLIFMVGTAIFGQPRVAFAETEEEVELSVDDETSPKEPEPSQPKPEKTKPKSKRPLKQEKKLTFFTGVGLSIPEVIPIEASVKFGKRFGLRLYVAPPVINVTMPVYVPEYSANLVLAKVYAPNQTLSANVSYGPHFGLEAMLFPWATNFYVMTGIGVRQITAKMNDNIEYYTCGAAARNCQASGTRSELNVKGSVTSTSSLIRASFGWLWEVGARGYFSLTALGVAVPVGNSLSQDLTLSFVGGDASNNSNAGLNSFLDPYEPAVAQALYDSYAKQYDTSPVPITGIAGGVRF